MVDEETNYGKKLQLYMYLYICLPEISKYQDNGLKIMLIFPKKQSEGK